MRVLRWMSVLLAAQTVLIGCSGATPGSDAREEARLEALVEALPSAPPEEIRTAEGLQPDDTSRREDLTSVDPDNPYAEVVKSPWLLAHGFGEPEYVDLTPETGEVEVPERRGRVRFAYRHVILYVPGRPPRAAWIRTSGYWGYPGFVRPGPIWWVVPNEWYWDDWWEWERRHRHDRVRKGGVGIPKQDPAAAPVRKAGGAGGRGVPKTPAASDDE